MNLWIDSASHAEISAAFDMGIVSGVTTNPILWARHDAKLETLLSESVGPISIQVGGTVDEMISTARRLAKVDDRIVVKVPMTAAGLRVCAAVHDDVDVNVTACMTASQALFAANAGATYVSILWGRIKDGGGNPRRVIGRVRDLLDVGYQPSIVVGSIRSKEDVVDAYNAGADIVTASYPVLQSMMLSPGTDKMLAEFELAYGGCRYFK